MKVIGEIIAYAAFAAGIGLLSAWPRYELMNGEEAVISIAFVHAGQRVGQCRQLSQEELNQLPPNMRKPTVCPRERHPVRIELRVGGKVLYRDLALPSGLWSDGKSNIYKRVVVSAGSHEIFVGMNDIGGIEEFNYEKNAVVDLAAGQNLVIRFDERQKQLVFK